MEDIVHYKIRAPLGFEEPVYKVFYDPVGDPSDSNVSAVAFRGDGVVEVLVDNKSWYQQILDFVSSVF